MRFKVDENLPVEVATELEARGHEADTVHDEGLAGASDPRLAGMLRSERRTLITFDVDFGNLKRYPPGDFPGLIVLRLRNQSKPAALAALVRVLERLDREAVEGHLWTVDETTIRTHD